MVAGSSCRLKEDHSQMGVWSVCDKVACGHTIRSTIAKNPRLRLHGSILYKQVAQLSQRERAARWVMAKSGRLELGDNIYGYYKSIFNHCDVFG